MPSERLENPIHENESKEEELQRRKRESEEAERWWQKKSALTAASHDRPLSEEEKEELVELRNKYGDRKTRLEDSDQLLTYEEFTEDSGGIPMFDNFRATAFFVQDEKWSPRASEIMKKFKEQNPGLLELFFDALDTADEKGKDIEKRRRTEKYEPERYKHLNSQGLALVPQHPLVYEVYCKLHALLTEEERKTARIYRPPKRTSVAHKLFDLFHQLAVNWPNRKKQPHYSSLPSRWGATLLPNAASSSRYIRILAQLALPSSYKLC